MRSYLLILVCFVMMAQVSIATAQTPETKSQSPQVEGETDSTIKVKTIVVRRVPKKTYTGKRVRRKMPGYRIQVYTGGNDRASKEAAKQMKARIQKICPELSVYASFQSPRWIVRVGDFTSRQEAQPYVKRLRRARVSTEARIVSTIILRAY